jgi:hypothetical protein
MRGGSDKMTGLRYIKIDGKTGLVLVQFIEGEYVSVNIPLYRIGAYLPSSEVWRLLEIFNKDIDRLLKATDIVEEVVCFIYRGCYDKKIINHEYEIRCDFEIRDSDRKLAYIFTTDLEYEFRAYGDKGEYHSRIDIWMSLPLFPRTRVDEITNELTDTFLDELGEIFDEPGIKQLRKEMTSRMEGRSSAVTLYKNNLELKLLEHSNPDSPLYRGYEYITYER